MSCGLGNGHRCQAYAKSRFEPWMSHREIFTTYSSSMGCGSNLTRMAMKMKNGIKRHQMAHFTLGGMAKHADVVEVCYRNSSCLIVIALERRL